VRAGAPLAADEIEGFYTRGEKPVGVLRVLRALDAQLVRSPGDLYQLTLEYLQDAAAHNVRYAEFFWNPTGTVHGSGIPYAMAQAAIVRAIQDAQQEFGITGRLIAAIDREASPEAAVEMVAWVRAHRCDEVIGIGIDYREVDRPPELFAEAYAAATAAGLKTTAHAGEFGMPWTNVRTALDVLQVDRIDHGYTVVDQPDFARQCAERGVIFTVVPTNSYYLRTLPPERWAHRPPDPPHAGPGPAHPPQHRRSDAAQGHAHAGLADDGARLRLRPGRPARLHAQRARWRVDRRHTAPPMAHAVEPRSSTRCVPALRQEPTPSPSPSLPG
jgi:adenosine deaminase